MKSTFSLSIIIAFLLLTLVNARAFSHGRRFAYTQQSNVLPKGVTELEIWNTYRLSRDYYYRRLDTRFEFEYGLGGNVMTAFYLNHEMSKSDDSSGAPGGSIVTSSSVSLSNEWKLKLSDPAADPFGSALYSEITVGLDEVEVEGKLIFDKQLDAALFAVNFELEHAWESKLANGATRYDKILAPRINLGFAYYITSTLSLGAEARYATTLESGTVTHSALFAGPSVAYSSERFWFVFTFLPQLTSLNSNVSGSLDLLKFERYQARFLFSMEF